MRGFIMQKHSVLFPLVLFMIASPPKSGLTAQTDRLFAPVITQAMCIPDTVPSDGQSLFMVTARVTDPDSHANLSNVYLDLSQTGGAHRLLMYDDGTHGDLHPEDSVFTLNNLTIPVSWHAGEYPLTLTAFDLQDDSTQETAWITVVEPNTAPVFGIITISPSDVPADDETEFSVSAEVFDANIASVSVNLFQVGGDSLTPMNEMGSDVYSVEGLTIPAGTSPGNYTITVRAVDEFGLITTGTVQLTVVLPGMAPVVHFVHCQPPVLRADGISEFVISAKVTDANGPSNILNVTLDLSALGGSSAVNLYDDGAFGDSLASDSIFTIGYLTVPDTVLNGYYTLTVTAMDEQNLTHTGDITVEVTLANQPPNIMSVLFSPSAVAANGISAFRAAASADDINGITDLASSEIDLSPVGGSANTPLYDDGTHGDLSAGDGIFTRDSLTVQPGITAGNYFLQVTVYDLGGLSGHSSEMLTVTDPLDIFTNSALPVAYAFHENYPNPFNPATALMFDLPARSDVSLKIFNLLGQEVRTLVKETLPAGRYHISWNGKDNAGRAVSSGVFISRIHAVSLSGMKQTYTRSRKMTLLK